MVAQLCPGEKNDELRNYLKATTEKLWQLTNTLTHHRNAIKTTAVIAVDAVAAIVKHYEDLLSRERVDRTDQCPRCASRNVRTFFDNAIEPDGAYFEECAACGWDSHPGPVNDGEELGARRSWRRLTQVMNRLPRLYNKFSEFIRSIK